METNLASKSLVYWNGVKKMNRDYNSEKENNEDRLYFYGFAFDVMHPFIFESFSPHFNEGEVLELGSFEGAFTEHLLTKFQTVDCVEASSEAADMALQRHGERIRVTVSTFEDLALSKKYENIVLTHVLEHLDDAVEVLKKIKAEWLAPKGRLFLVVPNANAPSRQIAVRMGLISHQAAVTDGEREHGHRITYSLDTLYRDVVASNMRPILSEGIFFKALANFQWDQLLKTDIISAEYLRGCYELGKAYPDLCSSIFMLCE